MKEKNRIRKCLDGYTDCHWLMLRSIDRFDYGRVAYVNYFGGGSDGDYVSTGGVLPTFVI